MSEVAPGWYADPWNQAPLRWHTGTEWAAATTAAAGWYADPWQQAPLRWFDGRQWTPATYTAPPQPVVETSGGPLARLIGTGGRLAVLDVETTGVRNRDRIVEIAILTLDEHGTVHDEFDTLINPMRDIGAGHIHGIDASMLADAPPFVEVADAIASRLDDAVVVAHNLPFDTRMVGNELTTAGIDIDWGMGLDTYAATRMKLELACAEFRIDIGEAHRALADARATAQLMTSIAEKFTDQPLPAYTGVPNPGPVRVLTRDSGAQRTSVSQPVNDQSGRSTVGGPEAYLKVVGDLVADLMLTAEERGELTAAAARLRLTDREVTTAHRTFLNRLVDEAVADHVVSDDELDQLLRVAALLDIPPAEVAARTNRYRFTEQTLDLREGLGVCFTGGSEASTGFSRDQLRELARQIGLEPLDKVTKRDCQLLVAADPASHSNKAKSAHKFEIPIASVEDFVSAVNSREPLPVKVLDHLGVASVCDHCGASWTASRRQRRCSSCTGAKQVSGIQLITCIDCSQVWKSKISRGRPPQRCDDCSSGRNDR